MRWKTVLCSAAALSVCAGAQGAYLFEIDTDGKDDGVLTYHPRFSYGNDTTIASQSATCTAYGTNGADSIFGGNGVNLPDTYEYRYNPGTEGNNLIVPAETDLGDGNLATGATNGLPGRYRIYATWPYTDNVSGGPTAYDVSSSGKGYSFVIDQNLKGNEWVLLGEVDWSFGDILVQQSCETNSFISMRAYGLLFEFVPEASPCQSGTCAGPADVTTTHSNPGDPCYGQPDGVIDGADLAYFVEQWLNGCPPV